MGQVTFEGAGESSITLFDVDGLFVAQPQVNASEWKRKLETFQAREGDVFICAYPKSGLHWIWEAVQMMLTGKTSPVPQLMESRLLDIVPQGYLDTQPSPRAISTHLCPDTLPASIRTKACKILYIVRDPRAVAVSYYHHIAQSSAFPFRGQWRDFLAFFLQGKVPCGSWFDHMKAWKKFFKNKPENPVLVVLYDDMIANPVEELTKISKFIGIQCDEKYLKAVADASNIQSLRQHKDAKGRKHLGKYFHGQYPFYRAGKTDDWKNCFTVSENEQFEENYFKQLNSPIIKWKSWL